MPIVTYMPAYEADRTLVPVFVNPDDREYDFLLHHRWSVWSSRAGDDRDRKIRGVLISGAAYMWPGNSFSQDTFLRQTDRAGWVVPWFTIFESPSADSDIYIPYPLPPDCLLRERAKIMNHPYMSRLIARRNLEFREW